MTDAIEKPKAKSHGNGNSSGLYYKIEVRSWHDPRVFANPQSPRHPFVIDKDWREWPVHLTRGGAAPSMPVSGWTESAAKHGLLTYEAAMGHLWGMYAFLHAHHMDLCIQARLVACRLVETYSITEESVSDVIKPQRRPWDAFMPRDLADQEALKKQD